MALHNKYGSKNFLKYFKRISIALTLLLLSALYLAVPSYAQTESITNYETKLEITEQGLKITETITYNFGNNQRRGIERDLALRDIGDTNYFLYNIDVTSIKANGAAVRVVHDNNLDYLRLRIGDPNATVTGEVVYEIQYNIVGSLINTSEGTLLNWDAVGSLWEVPIENITTILKTNFIEKETVTCVQGSFTQSYPCVGPSRIDNNIIFEAGPLKPGQAVTINADVTRDDDAMTPSRSGFTGGFTGTVGAKTDLGLNYATTNKSDNFFIGAGPTLTSLLIFLLTTSLGYLGSRSQTVTKLIEKLLKNRVTSININKNSAPVEFTPPYGLAPAELSVAMQLSNYQLSDEALAATIFDLTSRSWLDLETIPNSKAPGGFLIVLKKRQGKDVLKNWEKDILQQFFAYSDSFVLDKPVPGLDGTLAQVAKTIKTDLEAKGLWSKTLASRKRNAGIVSIIGCLVTLVGLSEASLSLLLVPAGAVLVACSFYIPKFMTGAIAPALQKLKIAAAGFEKFLTTEGSVDRLNLVSRKGLQEDDMLATLFPYAVIFGVSDKWLASFSKLRIAAAEKDMNLPKGYFTKFGDASGVLLVAALSNTQTQRSGGYQSSSRSSGYRSSSRSSRAGSGGGGGGGRSW